MWFKAVWSRVLVVSVVGCLWCATATISTAQSEKNKKADTKDAAASPGQSGQEVDPLKRPLSEKQQKAQQKALKTETGRVYKKWMDEDVRWIISDE